MSLRTCGDDALLGYSGGEYLMTKLNYCSKNTSDFYLGLFRLWVPVGVVVDVCSDVVFV